MKAETTLGPNSFTVWLETDQQKVKLATALLKSVGCKGTSLQGSRSGNVWVASEH